MGLQAPIWLHTYVTECLNPAAQMTPCAAQYYDVAHFLIHDLTYKARTLSSQTCESGDHSACQA